jgi:hypothetical protein
LALLFGTGMGLAGFLAGRATAEPAAVATLPTTVPTAAAATDAEQLGGQSATATEAPTATPLPTQPPTALPSATTEPTLETIFPTAEPDGLGVIAPPPGSPLSSVDYATLYEVWDIIAEQYDGDLPPAEELIQALVSGRCGPADTRRSGRSRGRHRRVRS